MLETQDSKIIYSGDTVTSLAYGFPILDKEHLQVYKKPDGGEDALLTLDSDYSVTGVGEASGGTVELLSERLATDTITILRHMPLVQLTDYLPVGPFPSSSHERGLDWLTMISIQLDEMLDRTFTLPVSTQNFDAGLPAPEGGKLLGISAAGDKMALYEGTSSVPLTSYGASLGQAADAGEARTTLDVYSQAEADAAINGQAFSVNNWTPDPDNPPEDDENGHGIAFPAASVAKMTTVLSGMDTGEDFTFAVRVVPADNGEGDAKFTLEYRVIGDGDNVDTAAWTELGTVTLTMPATAYERISGTFSGTLAGTSISSGDDVHLRLSRDPDDESDTASRPVVQKFRVIPV